MGADWKHVDNLTPDNFRYKTRRSAKDCSPKWADHAVVRTPHEPLLPPTLPSRLRRLLLPAQEQIAATKHFLDWISTPRPSVVTNKGEIFAEFLNRCQSLLSQPVPSTADECHPLHSHRREYTTSFIVNLVLLEADEAISMNFQTPGSINEMLIPFLKQWCPPSTSGPITATESVRKCRSSAGKLFSFTSACAKDIGSRAHAFPLFNTGRFKNSDISCVREIAAAEPSSVRQEDHSIFAQLEPKRLMPRLVPAMERLPMYALLKLYPLSTTPELQSSALKGGQDERENRERRAEEASLKRHHNDARSEVVASMVPQYEKPNENLYPVCHTFMKRVVKNLKSTKIESSGTFTLSTNDLENPVSKQYLLRLRNPDIHIETEERAAFSIAVPYFTGFRQIWLSDQGQDWCLCWHSNELLVFLEEIRLPGDGHLWIHVQSFKQ